jgi:hypothetical protein
MTAAVAPLLADEHDDDAPPALRLAAAMYVNGAELVNLAGHLTEEMSRDGEMSPWLKDDIARSVGRLAEALISYMTEAPGT